MRITSAGNVGVGTNDPQAILDVRANTNSTIRIANDGDGIATLYLRNTGTSDGSISQEAGDMFFQIAGDKKIELRNDGNFGIGRLNPDARLTVDTDQQLIARLASSNVGITGVRLEGIDTSATDNVYVDWFYDAENRQYGFGEGTASGSLPINSGIDHADVVIKDGNVRIPSGVGLSSLSITTNPLTLGDLTSYNMAFDANEIQTRNNGAAETLIINKAGGNVGIGWNNPQVQLDLYQVTGDDLRISASSSDYWGINAGNYFTISDSGTLRLRIYDNGKIVLGDDIVPETLLHLADQSTDAYLQSATGLYSYTPKGGDLLQIQNRSSGTDDLYAGIWFETGNPATNTTGTNRSARFAYVVQNDTAYTGNFVWQLRHSDASLKEMMRLNHKGHLKVPAKVHFGMTEANIDNDDNPGARLKIEHDQGTPDDAPVVYIHRQNNLSTPLKSYAALFIKDHQSNYPIAVRDATDDSHIFSILGDGQAEFYPKDTVANANKNCMFIDVNMSGSDVLTVDRTHRGLFIDVDSTATGGDTSNEHRIHGISADVRCTGDSDLIYGSYNYAESQHGSGIITQVVGTLGYAVADDTGSGRTTNVYGVQALAYAYNTGTGGDSNLYGTWSKALLTTSCDKDTATATGVYGEVELDNPGQAQTLNAAYAFQAQIDNDSAGNVSVTNSYLYYGNYQGTLPNGNVYGVYILDNVTNYFQGSLDVAGTKNFQIKHPVQSLANTHNLVHTVIEGPSADNMYNGMVRLVDGSATINIDTEFGMTQGTFVALNRNNRRSVTNEEGFTAVKCSLTGNILTITAESNTCTDEVFWMVIGQRQDEEIKASNKTDDDGYLILEPEQVEHVRPEKTSPQ